MEISEDQLYTQMAKRRFCQTDNFSTGIYLFEIFDSSSIQKKKIIPQIDLTTALNGRFKSQTSLKHRSMIAFDLYKNI